MTAAPRGAARGSPPLLSYVLHRYDWSESSLIVELFTRAQGRLVVVAKGAKRPTSQLRPVLLPFQRLHAQLGKIPADDRGEVQLLRQAEWAGGAPLLGPAALFPGLYLNELLLKLLARQDPHPVLFDAYADTLTALAAATEGDDGPVLRAFELLLLREMGVLPELGLVTLTLQVVDATAAYTLRAEQGLVPAATGGVPGFMVISSITDRHGYPIVGVHDGSTTDATPLRQRFGGWYVTGTSGLAKHAGNVYSTKLSHEVTDKQAYRTQIDMTTESARTDLVGRFDPSPYLSAQSDIVALMVLVHQTVVHNLITAVHESAPDAVFEDSMTRANGRDTTARGTSGQSAARLRRDVDRLVRAMLFVGEAPFSGTVKGTTRYAADFAKSGLRDARGRSLRDLDLERRLFKYPLSFLIYSESFNALPDLAKDEVYRQLRGVLAGTDPSTEFTHLAAADRSAILEILAATKPDFARVR